ncbi:hypothetical protein CJ179_38885 [Rhodococcus sp. ACS1]|uniref:hypothetical protein n=1 Tax=Rhodococcus sp. ACS1 TaxID=2028570 RepID=UPI000BB0FBEB|nr:hypothetical protein [Rhodococcus sp. ACS1]PBC38563.1 hypothetical protein CJ179_38885 [Rhodococcus sp. ACS1]
MPNLTQEQQELYDILQEDYKELCREDYDWDGFETIDRHEGDTLRWEQVITLITRGPSGQLYRWTYHEGLTERQEDAYYDDIPVPVKPVEKVVTITEYVKQ